MRKFIRDHSLGIFVSGLYLFFQLMAYLLSEGRLQAMMQGHADDTFGALIVVVFAKWMYERGSPAAKDPEDD